MVQSAGADDTNPVIPGLPPDLAFGQSKDEFRRARNP